MNNQDAIEVIESLLPDFAFRLVNELDTKLIGLADESGCINWNYYLHENLEMNLTDDQLISFCVKIKLIGEPNGENPYLSNIMAINLNGIANFNHNKWTLCPEELSANLELPDLDEDYVDAILSNIDYFTTFTHQISHLKKLNELEITNFEIDKTLKKQIFVGTITSLETFLCDAFMHTVLSSTDNLESFFSNFENFREQKFALNELYTKVNAAKDIAETAMSDVIYHNLPKVSAMYNSILDIKFPKYGEIVKAVLIRHDLVHRNGKTKEGEFILINKNIVSNMIYKIEAFVNEVNERLINRYTNWDNIPF